MFFVTDSFKQICIRSNGYNIFIINLSNNSVYINSTFLLMKTKQKTEANVLFI